MSRVIPNTSLKINRRYFCRTIENLISSNINEGTRVVFFFYTKRFHTHKSTKSTISIKSTKSAKRKQATFTQMFFTCIKSIKSTKSTKRQSSDFLPLRCFYAHKSHKNAKKRKVTIYPLDVFKGI